MQIFKSDYLFVLLAHFYLSPRRNRGRFSHLDWAFVLAAFPSFSVTTHSLTRLASRSPIMVALERCIDMTFSKRIQNISKWKDLLQRENQSLHETFCKLSYIACLEIPLLLLTFVHTHNSNKKIYSSRVRLHKNNLWKSSILN